MPPLFLLISLLADGAMLSPPDKAKPASPPPVLSLRTARGQAIGSTVTVRGVVLNGSELGNIRYVQDGTGGLALYAQPAKLEGFGDLRAGDSLQVTGQLKMYNGLLEMDPIVSFHKLASGLRLRALKVPVAEAAGALSEANESCLLEVTGVKRLTTPNGQEAKFLNGNANYLLDGLPGALLRVTAASNGPDGLVDTSTPSGEAFDIRGVVSQFTPSGTGGYQLLPRLTSDLVRGGGLPRLIEEPVPVDVKPTGFTIVYSTLNAGDTRVRYGLSANALKESRVDAGLTTRHSITLDNLIPGTTYYVEVGSRNAAGTETAPAVPFITGGPKRGRVGTKD